MPHTHDPHAWLEGLDDPAVTAWVAKQNAATHARLDADPRFAPLAREVLATLRDTRQIPFFSEHAGWLYNFHQDEAHPRGIYRKTTLAAYREGLNDWQIVLDVDVLADTLQLDAYLDSVAHCTLRPERVLVTLSVGGADASVTVEYDLAEQGLVDGGFHFPEGKNHIGWRDPDSVFVCPAWDERQTTRAGYPREVWLLQRGQSMAEATPLYQADEDAMMVAAWRFLDGDAAPVDMIEVSDSFYAKTYYLIDAEHQVSALPLPPRADVESYLHGDLVVSLADDWSWQGDDFAAGSLLVLKLAELAEGRGRAQCLLAPAERQAVEAVESTLNYIVVNLLDNVQSRLVAFERGADGWRERPVNTPQHGVIEFTDQPWATDLLCYSHSDFLEPAGLYRLDLADPTAAPDVLRRQPAAFDASPYLAEQWHARAPDGTEVPYFVVRRRDAKLDGSMPTLLYGYGGFEVPMLPHYVDNFGPQWLEKGGAFAVACIRGGGEFGPAWHQAAQGANRQVGFDDFIAIAEDLIARGLSSPAKLAIEGGSNGGLLVGAALTQRPELFKAVVCEVPLLDMLRYTELLAGASWIDEYGDPTDPAERAALAAYSPYHRLVANVAYPLTLFTTSARDDRVHPGHARKMVARLNELGHAALLLETDAGGHTGNAGQEQTAEELARVLIYLYQQLMD
ncbi:prolyl oligopeptidase family serine peptidase [Neisseriaceae bacterium JH1-16]|nr:prolyl oligopeptidase family serine peptidase [Neisseriaceae bacterium JH1-16]